MSEFPSQHHIALTVTDMSVSREWYKNLLGVDPVIDEDMPPVEGHHDGYHHTIFPLSNGSMLGLHTHAATAGAERFSPFRAGLDHLAFTCASRDEIESWAARLDELGVEHSTIIEDPYGYGLAFKDPDGIAFEFFAAK